MVLFLVLAAGVGSADPAGGQKSPSDKLVAEEVASAQGTWVLAKAELPDNIKPLPDEVMKGIEATIKNNLLTLSLPSRSGGNPRIEYVVLVLDPSKSPRHVDTINSDEKGSTEPVKSRGLGKDGIERISERPRERFAGIYKIEGDMVIVALATEPGAPRPTDFKPAAPKDPKGTTVADRSSVIVVHIRKKK